MYKLYRSIPLCEKSKDIDKWGEIPHKPRRQLVFVEDETGETFRITDLSLKKIKRNKVLFKLYSTYKEYIKKKEISSVFLVLEVKRISNISNYIKNLKKALKKRNVNLYAYYWQRDVGDILFVPHYHIIIIVSKINYEVLSKLFKSKNRCGHKAEFGHSLYDFKSYLKKKEFYAPFKKRNYALSKFLIKPADIDIK